MAEMLLTGQTDVLPRKDVYLSRDQWVFHGTGWYSGLAYIAFMFSGFSILFTSKEYTLLIYPAISFTLIFILRDLVTGVRRKWRTAGRRANQEWAMWVEAALDTHNTTKLPTLLPGGLAQACLSASLPKDARAQQYEFVGPADASEFCTRHRQLIVDRLHASFTDQQGQHRLAIGILQMKEADCLLLFRQISDECALFFIVNHRRNGTVVDLITQRWSIYNRNASPGEGRKNSDEEIAAKIGVPDKEKWRARPEWGVLGYWHLVDCICHKLGGDNDTPRPQTSASDSELDYYEKIVHVETVKAAQKRQSAPTETESSHRKSTAVDHNAQPRHFL
jgi:hypothetical protein